MMCLCAGCMRLFFVGCCVNSVVVSALLCLNGLLVVGVGLVVICVMGIWVVVVVWFSRMFASR